MYNQIFFIVRIYVSLRGLEKKCKKLENFKFFSDTKLALMGEYQLFDVFFAKQL